MATTSKTIELDKPVDKLGRKRLYWRRLLARPAIVYLIILTQLPLILTIYYSTLRWNFLRPARTAFIGLGNFARIAQDGDIPIILLNTMVLTVSVVGLSFALGMVLALLLNRPFAGRGIARTLLISPFLIMPTVASVMWKNVLLNPAFGLFSSVLNLLGLQRIDWTAQFPMASIVGIIAWQWTPFMMLILLAGLQSLSHDLVEAAQIDGAGAVGIFRYVVLPHLTRYIEIGVLMEVLFILSIFGEIFIVTSGGPGIRTTNLAYDIFQEAFQRWNVGQASALGLFAVVIANIFVLFFLRVLRHEKQVEVAV